MKLWLRFDPWPRNPTCCGAAKKKKIKIELPYDAAIALLSIYLKKTNKKLIQKDIWGALTMAQWVKNLTAAVPFTAEARV